jgi:hypothetical protein
LVGHNSFSRRDDGRAKRRFCSPIDFGSSSMVAAWCACTMHRGPPHRPRITSNQSAANATMIRPMSPGTAMVLAPADNGRTLGGTRDYWADTGRNQRLLTIDRLPASHSVSDAVGCRVRPTTDNEDTSSAQRAIRVHVYLYEAIGDGHGHGHNGNKATARRRASSLLTTTMTLTTTKTTSRPSCR